MICVRHEEKKHEIFTSFVQRYFGLGYGKATCTIDWLEQNGYVRTRKEAGKDKQKAEEY